MTVVLPAAGSATAAGHAAAETSATEATTTETSAASAQTAYDYHRPLLAGYAVAFMRLIAAILAVEGLCAFSLHAVGGRAQHPVIYLSGCFGSAVITFLIRRGGIWVGAHHAIVARRADPNIMLN